MAATMEGKHDSIIAGYTHFRKVGKSMCLTIPRDVRASLDWAEGQALYVTAKDNRVVIQSLLEHMSESMAEYDNEINHD